MLTRLRGRCSWPRHSTDPMCETTGHLTSLRERCSWPRHSTEPPHMRLRVDFDPSQGEVRPAQCHCSEDPGIIRAEREGH
jgi:hypothetical protein